MSLISRQKTCASCGRPLTHDRPVSLQTIVDDHIRYVAVHDTCSVFCHEKGVGNERSNAANQ